MFKKGDFVEVEYTGTLKDRGIVFDTTDEKKAKEAGLEEIKKFGPITICIGENNIIKGLDEFIENKEIGEYTAELPPEKAFGKKSAKLIQMIPLSKFKQQNIAPMPGLQLNIDGMIATIKNVSGGRTLVDFNHPLAGQIVVYYIKINKLVTDPQEKMMCLARMQLHKDAEVEIKETVAYVKLKTPIPEEVHKEIESNFEKKAISLVREIRGVKLIAPKAK